MNKIIYPNEGFEMKKEILINYFLTLVASILSIAPLFAILLLAGCQSKPIASDKWPKHECEETIPGVSDASYCYDESAAGASDVLWFFHGLEDNKEVWIKPTSIPSSYPDLISKMPPMRIVTISFGEGWMVTGYPARSKVPTTATIDNFRKIQSYIESKYGIKGPYKLMGHSMGGHNAAVLAKAFPEMWSKLILINPMFIKKDINPMNDYICNGPPLINPCALIRANYDNLDQWKAEKPILTKLPTMVTACPIDIFGIYDASKEYSKAVIDDDPICSHWTFPVDKIVNFLK